MSVPLLPYSSTRRKRPHWGRRTFLKPRTGPGTRCDLGQNGQTNRVPCAFGLCSTVTAQPGLHSLYRTGSGGATATRTAGRAGFASLATRRFTARFTGRLRRPVDRVRVVRVARIVSASPGRSSFAARSFASVHSGPFPPPRDTVPVGAHALHCLLPRSR